MSMTTVAIHSTLTHMQTNTIASDLSTLEWKVYMTHPVFFVLIIEILYSVHMNIKLKKNNLIIDFHDYFYSCLSFHLETTSTFFSMSNI